ncbi:MAG: heavy-metal-associated domain-containing protein [Parvibaculaceae bacterium]
MTRLSVLGALLSLLVTPALADHYRYEVTVEGMFCAYCAYNVSKQFGTLEGVSADTVDVDLQQGQVRFVSTRSVPDAQITASLEESGFRVTGIQQHRLEEPVPSAVLAPSPLATVTFDVGTAGSPLATDLLNRLGSAAFDDDGQFVVVAPSALEATILRPLIAGRKKAIKVAYEASVEGPVVITLLTPRSPPQK